MSNGPLSNGSSNAIKNGIIGRDLSEVPEWSPVHGYDFLLRDIERCDWKKIDVSAKDFDPSMLDWD